MAFMKSVPHEALLPWNEVFISTSKQFQKTRKVDFVYLDMPHLINPNIQILELDRFLHLLWF